MYKDQLALDKMRDIVMGWKTQYSKDINFAYICLKNQSDSIKRQQALWKPNKLLKFIWGFKGSEIAKTSWKRTTRLENKLFDFLI